MIKEAIYNYLHKQQQMFLKPKVVLFDMDGVLYDSMRYHARSWYEVAMRHNLVCKEEDFYMHEGRTGKSTINLLYQATFGRGASEAEVQTIYKEKTRLFNRYNDGTAMPGAKEVLEQVKACELDSIVVTGSGQRSLIDRLSHTFPGCFDKDKMVTAADVRHGKPSPEPYMKGLYKAKAKPNEAIVVENAPMGVQAASAAGIFVIAVNTGPLPDQVLIDSGADLIYPDMTSLAADWMNMMGEIKSYDGK